MSRTKSLNTIDVGEYGSMAAETVKGTAGSSGFGFQKMVKTGKANRIVNALNLFEKDEGAGQ